MKMGWKNWPCWLKGGVIGIGIGILISILEIIYWYTCSNCSEVIGWLTMFLALPLYIFFGDSSINNFFIEFVITNLTIILDLFIIGTLIGLIVGKINSKKRKK